MMNNENCIEKYNNCKETIKEISKDSKNDEYMSESEYEIYNFDKIKTLYLNGLKLSEEVCKSVDGLMFLDNDKHYFLEFKNGKVKNQDLRLKVKASVNIYCDICKKYISDMRETDELILIYNDKENSPSRAAIGKWVSKKAGEKFGMFGLGRYKKLYFKDVHAYTKNEFEVFVDKVNKN